jgi:hypothetical protein
MYGFSILSINVNTDRPREGMLEHKLFYELWNEVIPKPVAFPPGFQMIAGMDHPPTVEGLEQNSHSPHRHRRHETHCRRSYQLWSGWSSPWIMLDSDHHWRGTRL